MGTAIGLTLGYTLSYLANRYHWLRLDEEVYSLELRAVRGAALDGLWIAAAAILVSFLATLYPSRTATKIAPAEALRYE